MTRGFLTSRNLLAAIIVGFSFSGFSTTTVFSAEKLDYAVADPQLKVVRLDSSPTESFLSIRADTRGRLFVGGREALFVYEPDDRGGYKPRHELYRFPPHSWIYDIEIRGRDLYVLTLNALYLIPDGAVKRTGLTPKRLIWGVPFGHVHQCFHGLAWGPEGDLYLSMGDPLWYYGDFNRPDHWGHWTFFSQPQGTKTPYTGVGGVFRCRPDGSRFQVVARGLRNSCGLVFDRDWNLFTNDNDHEGMPHAYVPGRLNHVTPHSYFSWPRGWLLSKTPDRADLLETMTDDMGRAVPVGQTYYDETFLPKKYRNNLLVARWGRRSVTRFPLQHRGASFKTSESPLLIGQNQARPVGVAVGRGGRVFVTISYMAHNDSSPTYRSDLAMITRADDPDTHPFEAYDAVKVKPDKLLDELQNPSWWRRYRAHNELLRRGIVAVADNITKPIRFDANGRDLPQLIWFLASAWAKSSQQSKVDMVIGKLDEWSQHQRAEVRLQAVRALTEFYAGRPATRNIVTKALSDQDPQVRHAALLAFFKVKGELPKPIFTDAARSRDTYIRQAATLLLAQRATVDRLRMLCRSNDTRTRLAGVLAVGFRLTIPPATEPIPKHLPLQPWRSDDVYKLQYAHERVDLRDFGRIGLFTVAEHWKAGKHSPAQEELFALLRTKLDDPDEPVRLQAGHFLYLLNDPRTEPRVAKVRKASEQRRLATASMKSVSQAWVAGPFDDGDAGFKKIHPPETGAIDVTAAYKVGMKTLKWQQMKRGVRMFDFLKSFGNCDRASFYTYCRLESPRKQQIMLLLGSDDGVKVWQNGRPVWTNDRDRAALPYQDVVFIELQPGSNDLLVRTRNTSGECALYLHFRSLGNVAVTLPEKLGIETLAERLKAAARGPEQTQIAPSFLKVDWTKAVEQGDPRRGRKLFGADGIGCAKCHAVDPETAVTGGPSLADAGKRFTVPHLVESILLPSKNVSPVFRATLVVTKDGKTQTGLVVGETAEWIELLLADAKRQKIPKSEIEERKLQNTSPMPHGIVKKPDELRDLLAYLMQGSKATDRPAR